MKKYIGRGLGDSQVQELYPLELECAILSISGYVHQPGSLSHPTHRGALWTPHHGDFIT